MSKASQREARQIQDENEQQRRSKFLETLDYYLRMFSEILPVSKELGGLTELGIEGYDIGLRDLSPEELKCACEQALKMCKFRPGPGEIRECLKMYRERAFGGTQVHYDENDAPSAEEIAEAKPAWDALREQLKITSKKLTLVSREPGQD